MQSSVKGLCKRFINRVANQIKSIFRTEHNLGLVLYVEMRLLRLKLCALLIFYIGG